MNLRIVLFLSVVLTAVVLTSVACSSATSPPLPTPTTVETAPSLPPTAVTLPTIAPTATPVSPATPSPTTLPPTTTPSTTPRPTQTPVPTSTPIPTATTIPTSTPAPTATTDIRTTFDTIATPINLGSYPSPDGRAVAEVFRYECTLLPPPEGDGEPYEQAYEYIQLTGSDGETVVFADQPQSCGGLGAAGLEGYFWSGDGRYFYYGTAREGVPDGCGYFAPPYYRLDTADMTTVSLGYGALSPDGTMLALWTPDRALAVYAVSGEELARAPVTGTNQVQNSIAWSPDGRSLVYVLTSDYCPEGASTLVRLDLPALEPVVLREDNPGYARVRWLDNERLELGNIIGDAVLIVGANDGEPVP